jgi:hypothetical protein
MIRLPKLPVRAAQAIVTAAALIVSGAGTATAASARAAVPVSAAARVAVTPHARPAAGTLPLLNGDQVSSVLGSTGRPVLVLRSAVPGFAGTLLHIATGGRNYLIPPDALPYLGRGLDPGLFDAATLASLAASSGGRLPVSLAYRGARPALPGIMITSARAGRASGYLTVASARTFGAALLRQFAADHAGASYGSDGMFANGLAIALSGVPASAGQALSTLSGLSRARAASDAPRAPRFLMRTLTVHGTNRAGKPDTGDLVLVMNVDNSVRFGGGFSLFSEAESAFYHGTAKYSLPAGHYWAVGVFTDLKNPKNPASPVTAERLAILPQFTVAGAHSAASISERAATSRLAVRTPRPAVKLFASSAINRTGKAGTPTGIEIDTFTEFPTWISPTSKRPTVGTLSTYNMADFPSPRTTAQPYFYYIDNRDVSGLVHSQTIVVRAASLATVTARYFADASSVGASMVGGGYPGQLASGLGVAVYMPLPLRRTEYYTAGSPAVSWGEEFFQNAGTLDTGQWDTGRRFRPGEQTTDDWNVYPLHSVTNVNTSGGLVSEPVIVSASRSVNTLTLDLSPFGDNNPAHNSAGYVSVFDGKQTPTTGSYRVDENGVKLAAGDATKSLGLDGGDLFTHVKLAPGAGTVTVTLDATRTGQLYTLATATHTVWSWHAAADPGSSLPAGWACDWSLTRNRAVPFGRRCAPQPLLTLDYRVSGLDLTGTVPAGPQTVAVHVGHMALTTGSPVTGLTAQVSFDDGTTWQPATVTGSGGSYRVGFTAPASGFVSLRVIATDAAGGSVDETITRAYATGPAAAVSAVAAVAAGAAGAAGAGAAGPAAGPGDAGRNGPATAGSPRAACPAVPAGQVRCFSIFTPQPAVNRALAAGQAVVLPGWGARDIQSAYKLPSGRNPRQTVAVVEAFNSPNLPSDLAKYREKYGLGGCGTAGGCLRIVNQHGTARPLPQSGVLSGWDLEAAADVEMVSAACPHCRILVVEASTPSDSDIAAAENTAARLGASVISNSFGERETGQSMLAAKAFNHPGHTIVVSSGDLGFGAANFPANLATVTAVGATQLSRAANRRGWSERTWNTTFAIRGFGIPAASASGCSAYVAKPAWQHDGHCAGRTTADVAALGWNVAVYAKTYGGWLTVGGTSLSAPIIAAVYALAGNATRVKPGYEYAHPERLLDVSTGNNDIVAGTGAACGRDYLCVAKPGYDAPTGLGTPDGTGAF